ncbi:hypothetical protein NHH03_26790 [Stieleria sp. TO1_6]|uniref:hypothetical protein n=1 Tax=Stieleria tagensis TaxID=2956795 RepID=UPI00209B5426|nr:hypothetical protein [Stieleria tagensis]MCO8125375.1 hypothetical protein [Stieleria tagensis]
MRRRHFLSVLLSNSGFVVVATSTTGCGMILYPERRGQAHNHQIDWKIVALDGLGLILFFVPGVIAFVVDFCTGTIYLPAHHSHHAAGQPPLQSSEQPFQQIAISADEKQLPSIERIVSQHTGRHITLNDDQSRVSTLDQIDQYDQRLAEHKADRTFGQSIRDFFAKHQPA